MAKSRFKPTRTSIPGIYFIVGTAVATDRPEKIYYVSYYRHSKRHFEKAGRQYQDAMTPARAAAIRTDRIRGKELPNRERRESERAAMEAEAGRWTIGRLWTESVVQRYHGKADFTDKAIYENHLKEPFAEKEPSELAPLDVDRLRGKFLKTHSPAGTGSKERSGRPEGAGCSAASGKPTTP